MKRNKNRYISHPLQRDDAKEARAEVIELRVPRKLFRIGTRYVDEGMRCFFMDDSGLAIHHFRWPRP